MFLKSIIKLLINNQNISDILSRAIKISNMEVVRYIVNNFEYDYNIINYLYCHRKAHRYLNEEMTKILETMIRDKNIK